MAVRFIIDRRMLEDTKHQDLPKWLESEGYPVNLQDYARAHESIAQQSFAGECVVMFGGVQFVEQRLNLDIGVPGAYYNRERFFSSFYMPHFPLEWLGNAQSFYLPFGDFVRRKDDIYRLFGASRLFIRPDSGAKSFTGLSISLDDFDYEVNTLRKLTSVMDTTRIMIAPHQNIKGEYRFWIVNKEVVTQSQYMLNGKPHESTTVDKECRALAGLVAGHSWHPDVAFTCDIGVYEDGPKIVELNAFSTSGLYACDSKKLFKKIADAAMLEYDGILTISG